jgi:outer membrane protein W
VYLFDAMLTLKKRFFAEDLHESFRPFLSGGIGPVYGMNFPEVDELHDQKAFTFGGFIGAGTDISMDNKFFAGIRVQYRFLPFSSPLGYGQNKNHSMVELRLELGKRF